MTDRMMQPGYWMLDAENRPVKVDSVIEWSRYFESTNHIVKQDVIDDARVSTVFLGIDRQLGNGPPVLFETMIFGGEHDQWQKHCSTWEQAVKMHEKSCELVRGQKAR